MSNLRNTTRLPLKTSSTKKWKSPALTTDRLERKIRALEGSSNKLKLTTHRATTKSNVETYRPILNKGMLSTVSTKSSTRKQISKCGQCEKDDAKMKCLECAEFYCANCFAHFHLRGALQRHRAILIGEKREESLSEDDNLRELPHTQSIGASYRKSTMTSNSDELGDVSDEKTRLALYQQSFMQWRENENNKTERLKQKRESRKRLTSTNDTTENSNKLPNIEYNSSKMTNVENFILQHFRSADKNKQESSIQRSSRKKDQPELGVLVSTSQSRLNNTDLNDPSIEAEHRDDDLLTTRTEESAQPMIGEENSNNNNFEQERPITHISTKSFSRPNSSSIKKDTRSSRPNSVTLFQESLRSLLATKSNDELQAIIDLQAISSRPSSATLEKTDQLPSIWHRKWIPEQSVSNDTAIKSTVIDQYSINQFDLALDDLLDETKIELANRLNHSSENLSLITKTYEYQISSRTIIDKSSTRVSYVNSATNTPRRNSPFSFSNSLYKTHRLNSSSSIDTGDGGFFTDVLPRQSIRSPIPPLPILECSTSNEWKHAPENQPRYPSVEQHRITPNLIPFRKSSIENLSHALSIHPVTVKETHHRSDSHIDNDSLSSVSLPISVASSKADFINSNVASSTASSRRSSLSPASKTKCSSPTTRISSSKKPASTKSSPLTIKTTKDLSPATTISEYPSSPMTKKTSPTAITSEKPTSQTKKRTSSVPTTPKSFPPETLTLPKPATPKPAASAALIPGKPTLQTTKGTPSVPTTQKSSSQETLILQNPIAPKPASSEILTLQNPSSPTPVRKKSSPPIVNDDKKVTSSCNNDECRHESMISTKERSSFSEQTSQSLNGSPKTGSMLLLNRDEAINLANLPSKKRTRRRTIATDNESSKFRKLGFSVGDGFNWQEASAESMISTKTDSSDQSSEAVTPSKPTNINVAQQFSMYDNDDGRSSRTYQNVNDEECFNQLCSEFGMTSSDEDAILNEHLLNILHASRLPVNGKNLTMLELKSL